MVCWARGGGRLRAVWPRWFRRVIDQDFVGFERSHAQFRRNGVELGQQLYSHRNAILQVAASTLTQFGFAGKLHAAARFDCR